MTSPPLDLSGVAWTDLPGLGRVAQPRRGHRFGPESAVLAELLPTATVAACRRVVDLGAGCGVLGLSVGARVRDATGSSPDVDLVERLDAFLPFLRHNAAASGLPARVTAADLRDALLAPADLVVANPPFYAPGAGVESREPTSRHATHGHFGGYDAFLDAGRRALAPQGQLWLVCPADHVAVVLAAAHHAGLSPRRICTLFAEHTATPHRVWTAFGHADDPGGGAVAATTLSVPGRPSQSRHAGLGPA